MANEKGKWLLDPSMKPRTAKVCAEAVNKAHSSLLWAAKGYVELTGTIGGEEHRTTLTPMFGGTYQPEALADADEIGTRFGWLITWANRLEIIEAYTKADREAVKRMPVHDERKTREQRGADNAEYAEAAKVREAKGMEEDQSISARVA
jgi:hypothetical protein